MKSRSLWAVGSVRNGVTTLHTGESMTIAERLADHAREAIDTVQEQGTDAEVLEVTYTVNVHGEVLKVHLLMCCGGPKIVVHVEAWGAIWAEGWWGSDSATMFGGVERPDVFEHYASVVAF